MFDVGAEVITCGLSLRTPDSHGNHRCGDECFEVRTVLTPEDSGTVGVSDLMGGSARGLCTCVLKPAPLPLLRRKTEAFRVLVKLIRDWEMWDQGGAGAILDRLLIDVDRYLFASAASAASLGAPDPGPQAARSAFERAALYILEHRNDRGLGRPRHLIVSDVINSLNLGPSEDVLGGSKLLRRF